MHAPFKGLLRHSCFCINSNNIKMLSWVIFCANCQIGDHLARGKRALTLLELQLTTRMASALSRTFNVHVAACPFQLAAPYLFRHFADAYPQRHIWDFVSLLTCIFGLYYGTYKSQSSEINRGVCLDSQF